MKRLTSLTLALSLSYPSSAVLALPIRTVFADKLQGMVLKVWSGHDLPIDFIPSGEVVTGAVIGYPSIVLGGMAGTLCPRISDSTDCTDTGAPVIYLRQTKLALRQTKLDNSDFPLLPSSDGSTSLTLTTVGPQGTKNYILTVVPAQGRPEYAGLQIKPPSQKQTPSLPLTPVRQAPSVPVLDRIPTITSLVERQQTTVADNPSANSTRITPATTGRSLAVPIPSFARSGTRVSNNPTPKINSLPEVPRQSVRAPTQPGVPKVSSRSTSSTQQRVANPNQNRGSLRRIAQQSRVAARGLPPATKPQSRVAKPKVSQVSPAKVKNHRSSIATNSVTGEISTNPQQLTDDANAIAFGLRTANENGQIKTRTAMWRKAQSAIRLLRRGKTRVEAARIAKIPLPTLTQLIKWGQERP